MNPQHQVFQQPGLVGRAEDRPTDPRAAAFAVRVDDQPIHRHGLGKDLSDRVLLNLDQPAVVRDLPIADRPLRTLGKLPQMGSALVVDAVHLLENRVPVDQRIERDVQMLREAEAVAGPDGRLNVHAAHR